MENTSIIHYRRSFINQVIVRLDFLQHVPSAVISNLELEKIIVRHFPRKGKDQIVRFNSINVEFNSEHDGLPNANGTTIEGIQKEYFTEDGNKLILSNQFLIFEINKYYSFEKHLEGFRDIIQEFCRQSRVPVQRTGIRYINIFDSDVIKLQKNFFASDIAATFAAKMSTGSSKPAIIRSMHTNEYRQDSLKITFRYGMYNPEYPNLLRKNTFALDYDCYTDDAVEGSEHILQVVEMGHDVIQQLFESSITDYLRKVLNNE